MFFPAVCTSHAAHATWNLKTGISRSPLFLFLKTNPRIRQLKLSLAAVSGVDPVKQGAGQGPSAMLLP
jgi:hypothetical protein